MRTGLGALVAIALVGAGLTTSTADADVTKPKVSTEKGSATALKVDWTDVKGAAGYRVQYSTSKSFGSGTTTLPAKGQPEIKSSDTTIDGLSTGKQYFVRVADVSDAGKVGTYSAATAATPTYAFEAPGDLFRSKVDRDSMTVSWKAVSGAPGYTVRVYSKGNPTKYFTTTSSSVGLTGLKKGTTYYIRAYVVQPAAGSEPEKRLSDDSLEVVQSTTTYKLATPDGFKETSQGPTTVGLSWTGVSGAPDGSGYKVSYALNGGQTDHQKTSKVFTGTSGKLTGLANDTTYYATIYLVDSDGKRLTASSDFIVAKSVVPRGSISGKVDGVTGSDLTAAAYTTSGNVAQAVTVGSDNRYTLDVRPGNYKVQLMYTGGGPYASVWARSGSDGAWTYGTASTIQVETGKNTGAPDVEIHKGHEVAGTTVDRSGKPVPNVDLTAITNRGDEREVISLTRSDSQDGAFALEGLNTGDYWIRAIYSGDGFKTESVSLKVDKDLGVKVVLDTAPFRKSYLAYINGSGRVGKTLSVHATPWLAGSYPTTRASLSYQWKRNGKAIKGATKTKYKLGKADKGKKITITVTAKRYGYTTGSTTSKAKKVS
ncbi:fibronectin type III domain-containing protein [Microlunatus flavus]|uniref:fibronectin type III domain-containing protein n=1 Tax=Microlunatus flavus TaxID=1036181 RepID=UPI000B87AB30|nr:fibronectin type III domain-containing protein [Microlunatus flavus]